MSHFGYRDFTCKSEWYTPNRVYTIFVYTLYQRYQYGLVDGQTYPAMDTLPGIIASLVEGRGVSLLFTRITSCGKQYMFPTIHMVYCDHFQLFRYLTRKDSLRGFQRISCTAVAITVFTLNVCCCMFNCLLCRQGEGESAV